MNNNTRRHLLSVFALGSAALPAKWGTPVVKSVLLPAHATVSTCCITYDILFPISGDDVAVSVTSASLCDGMISIGGGGFGPGNWSGSGPVDANGDFSFDADTDINGCCVTVSGNADCCGFDGTYGESIAISGFNITCEGTPL